MTNKTKTILGIVGGVVVLGSVGAAMGGNDNKNTSSLSSNSSVVSTVSSVPEVSESNIKLASWELSKDYSGAEVLVVEYEWTNTDEKEANFATTFSAKVYQNGIECEGAIMVEGVDSQKLMNDIQPGITYNVKKAYVLQDKTTANVIVKTLFGSDNLIDEKIDLGGGSGISAPNGEIGETSIKIVNHKLSKDYKDKDVLVINYEFYNGEDSEKAFNFMFNDKAFQNGIECNSTAINCDDVDYGTHLNNVLPGYSYIVSVGYHISDMSDVDIKVADLFGEKTYLAETIKLSGESISESLNNSTNKPSSVESPQSSTESVPESISTSTAITPLATTPPPISNSKPQTTMYVLNTKRKVVHVPSCRDVDKIADENYSTTSDIGWAKSSGYKSCGHCNPY
ncbi:MAG: DUF5067 domain-containing protein [Oscillospiraceae bacterium]|nr:DUF5067 domain-containing protein [Oscillospiraceae bacterium]